MSWPWLQHVNRPKNFSSCRLTLPDQPSALFRALFSCNGRLLATLAEDQTLTMWNASTGAMCWSARLSLWDGEDDETLARFVQLENASGAPFIARRLWFSPDDAVFNVAWIDEEDALHIVGYNTATGQPRFKGELPFVSEGAKPLAFHARSKDKWGVTALGFAAETLPGGRHVVVSVRWLTSDEHGVIGTPCGSSTPPPNLCARLPLAQRRPCAPLYNDLHSTGPPFPPPQSRRNTGAENHDTTLEQAYEEPKEMEKHLTNTRFWVFDTAAPPEASAFTALNPPQPWQSLVTPVRVLDGGRRAMAVVASTAVIAPVLKEVR